MPADGAPCAPVLAVAAGAVGVGGVAVCNAPAAGQRFGSVTDIHFTAGTPVGALARLTLRFR